MKKILILGLSLGIALFVQSCKKNDPTPDATTLNTSTTASSPQEKQTSDQSQVNDATNHSAEEANKAISAEVSLSGNRAEASLELPCNVTVTTVAGDIYSRKLTFNGVNCDGNYNRNGVAIVKLIPAVTNGKWKDAGSKLRITLQDLKITRVSDGNYVTLNGVQTVTNVNGSNWFGLIFLGQTLVEKVRGNYTITFSNNATRSWYEAKTRTTQYLSSSTTLSFSLDGDTTLTATGTEKVSDWGKNSNNDDFTTTIISPVKIQNCSGYKFKFTAGEAKHYIPQGTLTVKFSSNSSGLNVNSCDATGYYLTYQATSTTSGGIITSGTVNQYRPY